MGDVRGLARAAALVGAAALLQASPIVRGHEVTFVASGDPPDPPRIVADFNGWDGAATTPSGDGRTYTLRVALDPRRASNTSSRIAAGSSSTSLLQQLGAIPA